MKKDSTKQTSNAELQKNFQKKLLQAELKKPESPTTLQFNMGVTKKEFDYFK